ncbi:fluoride ion transporter CrcB [Bordetella genomosp. 10]|uniref:Fluoride-specific ion channel FluC n=1 Tax=Bordetella genomosp. 10 TaxID=1416804 RepID=A0A261S0M1_9BORD|nr:fluoride efflux transporter CrcB [Bordetella genomosp. 10]OZI30557.1 fluoride ion transporter CrcB [Bordetella genomosp. 10]
MYKTILVVAVGGALGSLARWILGVRLNPIFPSLPYGTLAANLIAGYIVGVALAFFARMPGLPGEWRLFVITGLMGGLSTFSTFSAEVATHLRNEEFGWALGEILIHVTGSIVMTLLGFLTIAWISR